MSRDIKGTSLNELNDGLERAVRRAKRQLHQEIATAEAHAVHEAVQTSNEYLRRTQRETNDRINRVSHSLGQRIESTQKQLGARIDQQAKQTTMQLQALDQRHTLALAQLSDSVFSAMEAQNKYITDQVNRLDRNIGLLTNGLKTVNQSMQQLAVSTDQRFKEQQQQIIAIQGDIQSLYDRQASDTNSKLLAAGAALALLAAIRERTDVDKFAPKHLLDSIALKEERLRNIKVNPDACTITDANNLIDEAIVMENEAIRHRNEWEPLHKATLTSAMAVMKLLQKSETIKVASLYNETEENLETNYWTHGAYNYTLQEITRVKDEIEQAAVDMPHLKELQAKVEHLQHKTENMIIEASELGILSEQRIIVSNDILNAMISQGWELKSDPDFMGGEEDSDWREGTFAMLCKPGTGEELSILVLPEEKGGKRGNQIIFHRNDDLVESASAFQSRMEEIKREIEKSGYKLGALREPEHGNGKVEQLRNRESMRKKGAARQLQRSLSRS